MRQEERKRERESKAQREEEKEKRRNRKKEVRGKIWIWMMMTNAYVSIEWGELRNVRRNRSRQPPHMSLQLRNRHPLTKKGKYHRSGGLFFAETFSIHFFLRFSFFAIFFFCVVFTLDRRQAFEWSDRGYRDANTLENNKKKKTLTKVTFTQRKSFFSGFILFCNFLNNFLIFVLFCTFCIFFVLLIFYNFF